MECFTDGWNASVTLYVDPSLSYPLKMFCAKHSNRTTGIKYICMCMRVRERALRVLYMCNYII